MAIWIYEHESMYQHESWMNMNVQFNESMSVKVEGSFEKATNLNPRSQFCAKAGKWQVHCSSSLSTTYFSL